MISCWFQLQVGDHAPRVASFECHVDWGGRKGTVTNWPAATGGRPGDGLDRGGWRGGRGCQGRASHDPAPARGGKAGQCVPVRPHTHPTPRCTLYPAFTVLFAMQPSQQPDSVALTLLHVWRAMRIVRMSAGNVPAAPAVKCITSQCCFAANTHGCVICANMRWVRAGGPRWRLWRSSA